MTNLPNLIERLEAASGPSRGLDAEIAPITGLRIVDEGHPIGRVCYDTNNHGVPLPAYTASIDAALTLVPKDMRDELEITTLHQVARVALNLNHGPDDGPYYGSHACNSIPLALCIAALRAQEVDRG